MRATCASAPAVPRRSCEAIITEAQPGGEVRPNLVRDLAHARHAPDRAPRPGRIARRAEPVVLRLHRRPNLPRGGRRTGGIAAEDVPSPVVVVGSAAPSGA